MRVTHVITGVTAGGAEVALLRLVEATDRTRVHPRVVSLTRDGDVGSELRRLGVDVTVVGLEHMASAASRLARLTSTLKRGDPQVVQTWMYHADLLGGLAARAVRVPGIAWGIRQGDLVPATTKRSTRAVAHVSARLSRTVPDAIVCCSAQAAAFHAAVGYDSSRMVVIPNGLTVPDTVPSTRAMLRVELGLAGDSLIVARIGRWHPHKDYPLLLRSFAQVVRREPRAVLVAAGPGVTANDDEPRRLLQELGLNGSVRLLGERRDVTSILAASDIVVSTSNGEGFPNTVAEAMAVGVPAVVTDVGSSADIVGTTGWIVPPQDVHAFAAAVNVALSVSPEERRKRGEAARERVRTEFGVAGMADSYATLHERLAHGRPQARA